MHISIPGFGQLLNPCEQLSHSSGVPLAISSGGLANFIKVIGDGSERDNAHLPTCFNEWLHLPSELVSFN